jgi:hypothetical protein
MAISLTLTSYNRLENFLNQVFKSFSGAISFLVRGRKIKSKIMNKLGKSKNFNLDNLEANTSGDGSLDSPFIISNQCGLDNVVIMIQKLGVQTEKRFFILKRVSKNFWNMLTEDGFAFKKMHIEYLDSFVVDHDKMTILFTVVQK